MFSEINRTQKLWLLVSVTTFLILITVSALIITPKLVNDHSNVNSSPYVSAIYSLEDSGHYLSKEDIAADDTLISKVSSNPIAFGHTTDTIWIKAIIKNPTQLTRWSINISNRHFSPVEIFQKSAQGVQSLYLNDGNIRYNTNYQPVLPSALVDLPVSTESVVYFKLHSLKTTFFLLSIQPPEAAYRMHQKSLVLVLICIGLLISLVFVNMAMFCSLRKAYLAFYSLQQVFIILLIIVESGIGINYLWVGNTYFNNSATIYSLLGLVFTSALYTRSFFDTKHSPVIDKVLLAKAAIALAFVTLSHLDFCRTFLLQGGLPAALALSASILFYTGYINLKNGHTYALPYFLSTVLAVVFIVPMTYAIFGQYLRIYILMIEIVTLLCVCEAVMFCIAVNMRLDLMRTRYNLFNEAWIETLTEISSFTQLTQEKDNALAGSVRSLKRLSNTSHDIQHSIYSIRLHLDLLKGLKSIEKMEGRVGKIEDGLEFISNITQQLINEGIGLITTETDQVNFDEIFSCVVDQAIPLIQEKNIKLRYDKSNISHPGSAVIIRRLLENLVRNALQHTDKGEVRMSIAYRGDNLQLNVTDTGKGMNACVIKNLIEVTRSDNLGAVENNGYGLGLSIVAALCNQVNYKTEIESQLNFGTTVSIIIPVMKPEQ
jgi:signal transduction histidine kinase